MIKNNNVSTKKWLLANFFSVAAIIVTVANLWLATKLIPLSLSINELNGRVLANETLITSIVKNVDHIVGRVDDLYNYLIGK